MRSPFTMSKVQWRLRDWGMSRQRYWGCPIPIITATTAVRCRWLVVLPEDTYFPTARAIRSGTAISACRLPQVRQAGTAMHPRTPFVDSSCLLRALRQQFGSEPVDGETDYWMTVDRYIGGIRRRHLLLGLGPGDATKPD